MRLTKNKRNILEALALDEQGCGAPPWAATDIQSNLEFLGHNVPALGNLVTTLQLMVKQGLITEVEGAVEYDMNRQTYYDPPYPHIRDAKAYHLAGVELPTRKPQSEDEYNYRWAKWDAHWKGVDIAPFDEWMNNVALQKPL